MALEFETKHVVITGGNGGLGAAVVDAFVKAGAVCHLPQRERGGSDAGRAGIQAAGGVDLTNEAAVASFYADLPSLWASIHLAGGFMPSPAVETSLQALRSQLDVNLTTAFLCSREAVRRMRNGTGGRGGRIVNISSRAALVPSGGAIAYAISKAAVVALTRSLAEEVREMQIWVNAVAPSIIDTPANRAAMPKAHHESWPKPAEIARAILWLASPENELTTGAVLPVYGNS